MRHLLPGVAASLFLAVACSENGPPASPDPHAPEPYVKIEHPEWSRDAVIYELNTRQFTEEGTFRAAQEHLPRLKDLGIDIVWLMPIHPIGEMNRKGSLGSPYAVRDYYGVNPEFGTLADLRAFVDRAHELGMYVILDWVANHTAWDNPLRELHPEWYERDWKGDFRPTPWSDWSDIIDLDYANRDLREYMTEAMVYWVRDVGIDGFRCDVAGFVPLAFWNNLRRELDAIRPVFMLAEWETRDLHAEAFDMTYAWSWYNSMHAIAKGEADVGALYGYYSNNESAWPADGYRMTHVANHDKNSWDGTQFEQFGDALHAAIVLSVVGEGMPLVYSGQEAGNPRRLAFFEKDPIEWREHPVGDLYRNVIALKKRTRALWNGSWGATMLHVPNSAPQQVFSFVRRNDDEQVFTVFNFSAEPRTVSFRDALHHGRYTEYFSGETAEFAADAELALPAWGYRVYLR